MDASGYRGSEIVLLVSETLSASCNLISACTWPLRTYVVLLGILHLRYRCRESLKLEVF
ncbi:hypothetical protein BV25DRAFT_1827731 [Artomyces pyxidatus]|uniref:Uncharacterized protein n=1 Tax=Artomyces pyxidatus TaxID=48021 RepID=A0ACB8SVC7_9AGAM|nr:hypothetical protein BV25DRAFT_1827731 [Artomyces pyxidatus]